MKKSIVGVLMTLAVVLAGCGSSNQATGKTTAVQTKLISAVSKTTGANTAGIAMAVSSTGAPAQSFSLTGTGSYDFVKKQGEETEQISGGTTPGQTLKLQTVLDGTSIYEKLPTGLAGLSAAVGAKPWIKIDLNAVGQAAGLNFGGLESNAGSDPSQTLSMLQAASSNVTTVGTEQVRGVQTTHYKADLDFDAAVKSAVGDNKAALQSLDSVYKGQTVPVDVWVDSDNRIRKLTESIDESKINIGRASNNASLTGTVNVTMEYFDFGTPVSVTIPTPDQITDLSNLGGWASS